jgi:hypothetical protein
MFHSNPIAKPKPMVLANNELLHAIAPPRAGLENERLSHAKARPMLKPRYK